jgi:hypothetical protein
MTPRSRTVLLQFDPKQDRLHSGKKLSDGMSCAVAIGRSLWLAHDETLGVERLALERVGVNSYRFAGHRRFDLRDLIAWPARPRRAGEPAPEADLEGIAYADGYLWLVGSHSALRDGAKGSSTSAAIEALAKVRRAGNRFVLARIPLVPDGDGADLKLVKQTTRPDGRVKRAAMLAGGRKSNALTALLQDDPHLAPFLSIPSKDNGFDIEGIAVAPGGRLFVGLRGPVIDGWACVLELRVDSEPDRRGHLQLGALPGRTGAQRTRYRKHFLDLSGGGIRDLCLVGRDLFVLSGPPMRGKGRSQVRLWRNALAARSERLLEEDDLPLLLDLPYREKKDHAEGITVLGWDARHVLLLVIYDSVSKPDSGAVGAMRATIHEVPRVRLRMT